jgi:hypothetical protein
VNDAEVASNLINREFTKVGTFENLTIETKKILILTLAHLKGNIQDSNLSSEACHSIIEMVKLAVYDPDVSTLIPTAFGVVCAGVCKCKKF